MGSPCKNCPDRHEACWGGCEKYQQWKATYHKEQAAEKEWRKRNREEFMRSEQRHSYKRYKIGGKQ